MTKHTEQEKTPSAGVLKLRYALPYRSQPCLPIVDVFTFDGNVTVQISYPHSLPIATLHTDRRHVRFRCHHQDFLSSFLTDRILAYRSSICSFPMSP